MRNIALHVLMPDAVNGTAGKEPVEAFLIHVCQLRHCDFLQCVRHKQMWINPSGRIRAVPWADFLAGIAAVEMLGLLLRNVSGAVFPGFYCPVGKAFSCIAAAVQKRSRRACLLAAVAVATVVFHG